MKKILLTILGFLILPVITYASVGDLYYGSTTYPFTTALPIGTNGNCLTSNGSIPGWSPSCNSGGGGSASAALPFYSLQFSVPSGTSSALGASNLFTASTTTGILSAPAFNASSTLGTSTFNGLVNFASTTFGGSTFFTQGIDLPGSWFEGGNGIGPGFYFRSPGTVTNFGYNIGIGLGSNFNMIMALSSANLEMQDQNGDDELRVGSSSNAATVAIGTSTYNGALNVQGTTNTTLLNVSSTTGTSTFVGSVVSPCFATSTAGSCLGGAVNAVSNSDGTLTISPTTGSVVASLNLTHVNTWTGGQIFANATATNIFATSSNFINATTTNITVTSSAAVATTTFGGYALNVGGTSNFSGNMTGGTASFSGSLSNGALNCIINQCALNNGMIETTNTQVAINILGSSANTSLLDVSDGNGFTEFNVNAATDAITTLKNTLDNGIGNASIFGRLTVGGYVGIGSSSPSAMFSMMASDTQPTSALVVNISSSSPINTATTTLFSLSGAGRVNTVSLVTTGNIQAGGDVSANAAACGGLAAFGNSTNLSTGICYINSTTTAIEDNAQSVASFILAGPGASASTSPILDVGTTTARSDTLYVQGGTSTAVSLGVFGIASSTGSKMIEVDSKGHMHVNNGGGVPSVACASTCTLDPNSSDGWGSIAISGVQTAVTLTMANSFNDMACMLGDNSTSGNYELTATSTTQATFSTAVSLGTANIWYNCVDLK